MSGGYAPDVGKIHSDIDETVMVMVEPATVEPIGSAY
jgi:hypothetical protein